MGVIRQSGASVGVKRGCQVSVERYSGADKWHPSHVAELSAGREV